jgi:hypothetical protein
MRHSGVTAPGVATDAPRAIVERHDESPGSFVQIQSPFGMSHPGKPMRVSLRGQTFPVAPIPRLSPGRCSRNDFWSRRIWICKIVRYSNPGHHRRGCADDRSQVENFRGKNCFIDHWGWRGLRIPNLPMIVCASQSNF